MDLGDFFSQIWVKNDHWVQINVKWELGSEIFPFGEEVGNYFDNKVLLKNNRPFVSFVFKINRIPNYKENNRSTVLKQYFVS